MPVDTTGCILTNAGAWSNDGEWIAFDERSDAAGSSFDGSRILAENVRTGELVTLFEARHGARCGVVAWHPHRHEVAFILGPEHPTAEYCYGPSRRLGAIASLDRPGIAVPLEARDLVPPFTPGALRGGTHVHQWHPRGDWLSFTYDDDILMSLGTNRRTVAIAWPGDVAVPKLHPRNRDGTHASAVAVRTVLHPAEGSDEIGRACEEAWIGADGYVRPDGTRQRRALAFRGTVHDRGRSFDEVYVVDLLERPPVPISAGEADEMPPVPSGFAQRRLTFTANDAFPGLAGPRHWLRSSPDGGRIGILRCDHRGVPQFCTVSPNGGAIEVASDLEFGVASSFTWLPSGAAVAFISNGSVGLLDVSTGRWSPLTPPSDPPPRPEACVVSPDGSRIAFVRSIGGRNRLQIADAG